MQGYTINQDREIDLFIRKFLIGDLETIAGKWLADEGNREHISTSRIRKPDAIELTGIEYRYAANIAADGDFLRFDAALLCSLELRKTVDGVVFRSDFKQWLTSRCTVAIDERYLTMVYSSAAPGSPKQVKGLEYSVDNNLVPYIGKDALEGEAERFLADYCPEALETPMPVPIFEIVGNRMGLGIRLGGVLADRQGIIGQVCFSDMTVKQVCFQSGNVFENSAPRGTVVVDIRTFKRNEGCVNNTLAHEAYHWYRHRIYGTIRDILHGEQFIACRRTRKKRAAVAAKKWTDEDRIEWQANGVAPRILMSAKPFMTKVAELYEKYGYTGCKNDRERNHALEMVITDLARFYIVSKQSAKIRMLDLGYTEAASVYNYEDYDSNRSDMVTEITTAEAFREYCENTDFRTALDSGKFRYVNGSFVIDHENYVRPDGLGEYKLTEYAKQHMDECALHFTNWRERPDTSATRQSGVAFRMDSSSMQERTRYEDGANYSIIDNAEALLMLRENFDTQYASHLAITQTFAETAKTLMERKKWNSVIFKEKTHLDDSMYSRLVNNSDRLPSLRTAVAICVGLGVDAITANKMLALAGHSFGQSKEHQAFCYLFSALHGKSIDECNAFLESMSIAPLGNSQRSYDKRPVAAKS